MAAGPVIDMAEDGYTLIMAEGLQPGLQYAGIILAEISQLDTLANIERGAGMIFNYTGGRCNPD